MNAPLQSTLAQGRVFARIAEFHPELTAFRRDLHAHPELGFEEVYTSGRVVEMLKLCRVDSIHTGLGKTGVVALVHGQGRSANNPGRMMGLRADMDALPLQEFNECNWKSSKPGLMHGCGHDGHTAMLIGAARYLAETRRFDGTAVLIFQPGEEGFAGAKAMIDDGLFEVDLKLSARAAREDGPVFVVELVYGGLFAIDGVPAENLEPVLLIECPRFLFPFARRIIADVTAADRVVIVDTNNPAELPPSINDAKIQGIIDHHMLVGGIKTKNPIDITFRSPRTGGMIIESTTTGRCEMPSTWGIEYP